MARQNNLPPSFLPSPRDPQKITPEELKSFTTAKMQVQFWMQRDPDPRMTSDAIRVGLYLLHRVSAARLQCNTSHPTISDDLNMSLRRVERAVTAIKAVGWVHAYRQHRNDSNCYRFVVNEARARAIEERVEASRQARAEERELRKLARRKGFEPTPVAVRDVPEPTPVAVPEPTPVADKHLRGTRKKVSSEEEEPLKVSSASTGYGSASQGDDGDYVFPVPANEDEADKMLAEILDGVSVLPGVEAFFRRQLLTGVLRKSMIDEQRELAA